MRKVHTIMPIAGFVGVLSACGATLSAIAPSALAAGQTVDGITMAALWLLAATAWLWLTLSSTLSVARRVVPVLRHCHLLDVATPPWIRAGLDRILIVGLTIATVLPLSTTDPASAQTARSPTPQRSAAHALYVRGGSNHGLVPPNTGGPHPTTPPTRTPPIRRPHTGTPLTSDGATQGSVPGDVAMTYVVREGDNLWVIAQRELARRRQPTSDADVARYWAYVIRANRANLRSGNPNLIFVGEAIHLPA